MGRCVAGDGLRSRRDRPCLRATAAATAAARGDQLCAGRPQGTLRDGCGAHEGRQAGDRESARRPSRRALRSRRPPGAGCGDVAGQASAGGRSGQAARRHELGPAGRDEPLRHPGQGPLSQGLLPAAASQSSGRRHGVSQVRNRRSSEAGGARPHPVRSGFRYPRSLSAGVSRPDLSDDAARSGGCLRRASW